MTYDNKHAKMSIFRWQLNLSGAIPQRVFVGGSYQQTGAWLAHFEVDKVGWHVRTLEAGKICFDSRAVFPRWDRRHPGALGTLGKLRVVPTPTVEATSNGKYNIYLYTVYLSLPRKTSSCIYWCIRTSCIIFHCQKCNAILKNTWPCLCHHRLHCIPRSDILSRFHTTQNTLGIPFRLWMLWPGPSINQPAWLW